MTSHAEAPTVEDTILGGAPGLIRALDAYVLPVVISQVSDIKDPNKLAYEAGRRSIVDELLATLKRKREESR